MWSALFVSSIGAWMQTVGAQELMLSLTSSATPVALIQSAASLPVVLVAVPAGAVGDLFDRRRFLILAQSFILLAAGVLVNAASFASVIGSVFLWRGGARSRGRCRPSTWARPCARARATSPRARPFASCSYARRSSCSSPTRSAPDRQPDPASRFRRLRPLARGAWAPVRSPARSSFPVCVGASRPARS